MNISFIPDYLWSWPLPLLFLIAGVASSFAFRFVQFTHFFTSWRLILFPSKTIESKETLSPIQAFLSTLSAVMGNGSLVGMATAMYAGGPGAAFWLLIFGLFAMPVRFTEVLASAVFTVKTDRGERGGPMVYLARIPGGTWLPYVFSFICLCYCFVAASLMQSNSITGGITEVTGIQPWITALVIFFFLIYIMFGGASRIISFSETLAPVKVILFVLATGSVIIYFAPQFFVALKLMVKGAFATKAFMGGLTGHVMSNALRLGIARVVNASETGLGSASVMFGATGGKKPAESSVMSMALVFTIQMVCFFIMLAFTMAGTWNSGKTAMPLVIATYSTVFGTLGAWVAVALAVLFGVGTLVGYAFIGRECWLFLTKGRWEWVFLAIYCIMAPIGALSNVEFVWNMVDLVVAGLTICNLYGLLWLIPSMRKNWNELEKTL